jgi:membrane protein implicated in regulation of membrane protease activity
MSATAKTLGSLGIALVALVLYLGAFIGLAALKIAAFGYILYLGLALTVVLFVVMVAVSVVKDDKAFHN